jgi:hypothetical protein
VKSGDQHWPHRSQPFRSWPNALALTPDGSKLYVTLPGCDGYPDWRVAIVDTAQRSVRQWVNLRPAGQTRGTRPVGIQVSPFNTAIYRRPYVVVLNEFANFASVIDTRTDAVIGEFQTDFYAQDLIFNANGTPLYPDRFGDQVRAFAIGAGPSFTQIAAIRTGANDRPRPRASAISSRYGSHALALGARPGRGTAAGSVDTSVLVAGLGPSESVDTCCSEIAGFGFDSLGRPRARQGCRQLSDSR